MTDNHDELEPPFDILEPAEWQGPVIFNSPHSGSIYRIAAASIRRPFCPPPGSRSRNCGDPRILSSTSCSPAWCGGAFR
jgi:hypothetical protein